MTPSEYVNRLLAHAGIEVDDISQEETESEVVISITVGEEEVGMLIGHHGETLAAIQRITRIIFRDSIEKRISVNINDYRERRQERLEEMADQVAERINESGEAYTFGFLPSNERFVIHSYISEKYPDLVTVSEGEGKGRRLTVSKK